MAMNIELFKSMVSSSTIVSFGSILILLFYLISMMANEWKVGVAMHEGHLRLAEQRAQVGAPASIDPPSANGRL